ncbi:PKD domain-containing protein [Tautonia marina]|uniref:PKD domain-containing protein n=1 Tax=Tautonia marina TaxID=2653855 RepID=UPI001260DF23|nr:PKD domain-containing protein [Tautonia marina]
MSRPNRLRVRRAKMLNLEPLEPKTLLSSSGFAAHFDFGLESSPADENFIKTPKYTYNQERGFGWQSTRGLGSIDRGEPNDLLRDFHQGRDHTFMVDVPVGVYDVTPTLGDAQAARDQISLWIEGDQVASNVRTSKGEYASPTFRVIVADGQLNMRLADQGGVNSTFALNALSVVEVTPLLIDAGADRTGMEGKPISFEATASGAGPFEIVWEFGDGSTQTGSLTPTHTYLDNGTYTATVRVTDAYGITSTDSLKVTVDNVAPAASLSGPSSGQAFVPLQFAASATDSSPIDQSAGFDYRWLFGDGTQAIGQNVSHTFAEAGTFTITMTATDKDGGSTTVSTTTTIAASANTAPLLDPVGDQEIDELTELTFVVTASDQDVPAHGLTFSLRDAPQGASIDPSTGVFSWTPTEAQGPASYSVILQVSDGQLTDQETITVRVNEVNAAPVLTPISNQSATTDTELRFQAVATDPDLPAQILTYSLQNAPDGASIDPATGQFSWIPTTSQIATHSMTVLVSDGQATASQSFTVTVHAPLPANTILIDQAWLAARGDGPYYLDQADTTYVLQTDVTVEGTAFIVLNSNITFDLNGHTITYGNSAPIHVPNAGFEDGSSPTDAPGWDLSQAPSVLRAPAREGMWGTSMLRFEAIQAPETIVSEVLDLPSAGVEYTAAVSIKGRWGSYVTLSILDAKTGSVLASSRTRADGGRTALATLVPPTAMSVRLAITAEPPEGESDTIDLDFVEVSRARESGIVATPSTYYLPSYLQTSHVNNNRTKVRDFTVTNGRIVQGPALGYQGIPLYLRSSTGATVDNVELRAGGLDTHMIHGQWSTNTTVRNTTIVGSMSRVSNRQAAYAAVNLSAASGILRVENNEVTGSLQMGILISGGSLTEVIVHDNDIRHDAVATNSYGIVLYNGLRNFEISGNTVIPINGRGILLDGAGGTGVIQNGSIYNNHLEARERPNLEYSASSMEATAFRMRNYSSQFRNISIHDNMFVGEAGPGLSWAATGARISASNGNGQMTDANIHFNNNTFKAIVTEADPSLSRQAWGLTLSGIDAGTGITFSGNTFESNHIALNIGDNDSYDGVNEDITFFANTFRTLTEGASMPFASLNVGEMKTSARNLRFLDNLYADGAPDTVRYVGIKTKDLHFGLSVDFELIGPEGDAVADGQVRLYDREQNLIFEGTTDTEGRLASVPVVNEIQRQTTSDPRDITIDPRGPFTLEVTRGDQTYLRTLEITTNTVRITFDNRPQGLPDFYTASGRTPLVVDAPGVLANDHGPDGVVIVAELVEGPTNGTLNFNPDGSFTYVANTNFSGIDQFTYRPTDTVTAGDPVIVSITVEPPIFEDSEFETVYTEGFDTGIFPVGWRQWSNHADDLMTVSDARAFSPRYSLQSDGESNTAARAWVDQDFGPDVRVSASVFVDSLVPVTIMARGIDLETATPSYYAAVITRGLKIELIRVENGLTTTLGTVTSQSWLSSKWVRVTLEVLGSTVRVQVQRLDTNAYLDGDRSFRSDPRWAIALTDEALQRSGAVGIGRIARYAGSVHIDDFQVEKTV